MNKKGLSTIQMFIFVFFAFLGIVFLGLAMWGFDLINQNIGIDVMVGQVNLQNITNQSFGQISNAFMDNGDNLGIILLLGMCLVMILNGYFMGRNFPKLWLILDIFILIFVFIVAVYIAQTYDTLINSTTLLSIYGDNLPKSSTFILNLPMIVGIVGALIMIFTYAGLRRYDDDLNTGSSGGYYQ